jgi:hypothetical protein
MKTDNEVKTFVTQEIEGAKKRMKNMTDKEKMFWINDGMITAYNNVLRLVEPKKRTIAQAAKRIVDNKRKQP